MRVITLGCLFILGIISLFLMYRMLVHYRLNRVSVNQSSRLFKLKLAQFKQKELRKSLIYLLVGLSASIIVSIITIYRLEITMKDITTNNRMLQSEVRSMKQKGSTSGLLEEYPSSGIGLKKNLVSDNQTIDHKEKVEHSISNQLHPYIGKANFVFSSSSESDTFSILLTGSVESRNANLVILGQNISAFIREISEIKNISEIQININDQNGNDLYKGSYIRDDEGQFRFQSKLRKGKG